MPAICITIIRRMLRDPNIWTHPDVYDPDRFLQEQDDSQPDPLILAFGFGRRSVVRLGCVYMTESRSPVPVLAACLQRK